VILRRCTKCKLEAISEKDLDLFVNSKRSAYSKENTCKQCKTLENNEWRLSNSSYRTNYHLNNLEKERANSKRWLSENKAKARAIARKYQATKLKATPSWVSLDIIEDFYKEAEYFQMEVDHIIPLQNPIVCGLHVEHNLQLLTKEDNRSKGNKLEWKRTA